ncbi:hypothetical protein D3C75_882250 [compost metagenome]
MHRVKEVHTAEVFRALQAICQLANRNGRGVRRQNGIRAHFIFHFCQNGFLHFRVFNYRFNDHIDTLKASVIQRRMNGGNHARQFHAVNFAALKLFVQQFAGFVNAQFQRLLVNILH